MNIRTEAYFKKSNWQDQKRCLFLEQEKLCLICFKKITFLLKLRYLWTIDFPHLCSTVTSFRVFYRNNKGSNGQHRHVKPVHTQFYQLVKVFSLTHSFDQVTPPYSGLSIVLLIKSRLQDLSFKDLLQFSQLSFPP